MARIASRRTAVLAAALAVAAALTTVVAPVRAADTFAENPIVRIDQQVLGNIFYEDQPAAVRLSVNGDTMDWRIEDLNGTIVDQGVRNIGNGNGFEEFDFPLTPGRGYFVLRVTSRKFGGVYLGEAAAAFAIVARDDVATATDSPFGVGSHMQATDPRIPGLMRKAGVKHIRDAMLWDVLESPKGTYNFAGRFDTYMGNMQRETIKPHLILCYGNPNYDGGNAPYTAEGIDGYIAQSKKILDRYGSQVTSVEVYNEWNVNGTGPADRKPSSYLAMLQPTYTQLKAIRPDLTIAGASVITQAGGTAEASQPDYAWLEELFRLGGLDYLDVLSVHLYTPFEPEGYAGSEQTIPSFSVMIDRLNALMRQYNGGETKPIWVTETGWGTGPGEPIGPGFTRGELDQARFLVRAHMLLFERGVERVYVYDSYDVLPHAFKLVPALDFGLVRFAQSDNPWWHEEFLGNFTPKPAYVAYATMTKKLTGATFAAADSNGPDLYHYRFTKGANVIQVLWAPGPPTAATIAAGAPVTITDLVGRTSTASPVDGVVTIDVSSQVVYVEEQASDADTFPGRGIGLTRRAIPPDPNGSGPRQP